ncbi:D-alanyl-D-alanine carboxypeptidase [Alphaproteobacteria bacterium]|nr:D-alanyl-D-alanine carboxypeptidase [Alphaproteobacteria bacterium]
MAFAKGNPRYASIVMDSDTGEILSSRYADKRLHPASLTKAMTLMLLFDAIENNQTSLNDRIRISTHAASMVPSKLDLPAGSSIRVKDAILSLVTKSANDIAVAVAEHVGGSEHNFARLMNKKAREIGMKNTVFVNASGLHHKKQVSTARDMAKMGNYLIQTYPSQYRYFSTKTFSYRGKTYRNHNRLMDTYDGMDGLKTGYVAASGFNLIASAVQGNKRLVGVVFGGRTSKSRNAHMKDLLDRGFAKKRMLLLAGNSKPSVQSKARREASQLASLQKPARIKNPPVPTRKPSIAHAVAALSKIAPATGLITASDRALNPTNGVTQNHENAYKWVSLDPLEQFGRLMGEGDLDPDVSDRIETGLIAINAHKSKLGQPPITLSKIIPVQTKKPVRSAARYQMPSGFQKASLSPPVLSQDGWAIQVGAFTSRAATDNILMRSLQKLPPKYSHARPIIAPLQTTDGWVFRARLAGYSREEAARACAFVPDCLLVAPQ